MTVTFRGDEEILISYELGEIEVAAESTSIEIAYELGELVLDGAPPGTVPYRILITRAGEIVRDRADDILLSWR